MRPWNSCRLAAAAVVLAAGGASGVVFTAAPAVAQRAARDAQAEAFVSTASTRALAILNNRALSVPQKAAQFRTFVDQVADVPRISTFVLGRYARIASPAQRTQFNQVFRQYAASVYESRLDEYRGERIQVTGSVIRSPGDVVVTSLVSGGQLKRGEPVRWRVLRSGASWRIVDVEVRGVWLAVVQQQDFTSTLDSAGGDLTVLINQLRQQTARRGR